jgi:hypothetical protein
MAFVPEGVTKLLVHSLGGFGTVMDGRMLSHFRLLEDISAIACRFDIVALKVQEVSVKFPGKWISVDDEQLRATQGVDEKRSTDRRVRHGYRWWFIG